MFFLVTLFNRLQIFTIPKILLIKLLYFVINKWNFLKMKNCLLLLACVMIIGTTYSQKISTPLELSGFKTLTSHQQMINYIKSLPRDKSPFLTEDFALSATGMKIPVLKFSTGEFGNDEKKLKVLLFAQQHGNEPSGKEGVLMLLSKFASGELSHLLQKLDLAIIPMMNPDGNNSDKRRNGNGADLNRDHLILLQPENQGLHKFFNKYLFEVSMDVHEYGPFSRDWMELGYRKNSNVTAGILTNINTPQAIRTYSRTKYFPWLTAQMKKSGYSFSEYTPGGPPEIEYIRQSTFDINDGRQSIGSLGALSFIQEGMNGRDSIDNIEVRTKSQMTAMLCYLEFMYQNADEIKLMVKTEREKLVNGSPEKVAIQMKHERDGSKLEMTLLSTRTGKDTVITVSDYCPVVKSLFDVEKPFGYLIPADDRQLLDWANRHQFQLSKYTVGNNDMIEGMLITSIDSIDFEGDIVVNPIYSTRKVPLNDLKGEYYLLPTKQLAGNVIVQALEPKSMIGLVTYKQFEHLLKPEQVYPVLRIYR